MDDGLVGAYLVRMGVSGEWVSRVGGVDVRVGWRVLVGCVVVCSCRYLFPSAATSCLHECELCLKPGLLHAGGARGGR
eukprot:6211912-Prorocentrum_lima.AAC.1